MNDITKTEIVTKPDEQRVPSLFENLQVFETAQRMATMLAKSTIVPKQYQDNISNCFLALETAHRLGTSVLAIMQNVDYIYERPSFRAKYLIGAINTCGRFSPLRFELSKPAEETENVEGFYYQWDNRERKNKPVTVTETIHNQTCRAYTKDKEGNLLVGPEVSLKMAVVEGWYSKRGSKWKTLPELMLQYRAASFFVSLYAPDLTMGLQTTEELADVYGEAETTGPDKPTQEETHSETKKETGTRTSEARSKLRKTRKKKETSPEPESEKQEEDTPKETELANHEEEKTEKEKPSDKNPEYVESIHRAIEGSQDIDELNEVIDLIRKVKNKEEKERCKIAFYARREDLSKTEMDDAPF